MAKKLKPPKGSPAKIEYHINQLRKLFARSTDERFLQAGHFSLEKLDQRTVAILIASIKTYVPSECLILKAPLQQRDLQSLNLLKRLACNSLQVAVHFPR